LTDKYIYCKINEILIQRRSFSFFSLFFLRVMLHTEKHSKYIIIKEKDIIISSKTDLRWIMISLDMKTY